MSDGNESRISHPHGDSLNDLEHPIYKYLKLMNDTINNKFETIEQKLEDLERKYEDVHTEVRTNV